MKIPAYLKKGDTIGLVCPAGFMDISIVQACINSLKAWGYHVKLGKTVGHQHHYFSGTDEERLVDFQQMLDDKEVKAILCARGGYGVSRIVDHLKWDGFKKQPKWIIGFSDITVFHSYVFTVLKTASLHAPMANAFNEENGNDVYVHSLKKALAGKKLSYQTGGFALNRSGVANGMLVGGNLSLLAHQVGTASDIDTKNKILFIEDISEYKYNIDRMLVQLDRAGKLEHLAGLIVGGFSDIKDTSLPFGASVEELILNRVAAYQFPVCFHFPVSHDKENYALKIGVKYTLKVGKRVTLREMA
jgi:muramoyltetrapeptide carboxypeptidase